MYVLYIQCILEWDFPFCNFAKCIVYTEYICVYVICMCVYVYIYVCICVYMYVCICMYIYTYMYVYVYICMGVGMCKYINFFFRYLISL